MKTAPARPLRQRLAPAERERQIIDGAIAHFAGVRFSGRAPELSRPPGITQPLPFR